MIFEHQRFEIWNALQHPLKHSLADFLYVNPAMPGVTNVESAIAWIVAILYPNAKAAVATPGDLPLIGNTINDYRVVTDDGDGLSASYRWEQREGEATPSWHKVMDMDWSTDSVLAAYLDITQDLYVVRNGRQDLDGAGAVITGVYAGQTINGGTQANQNLTFRANSGDGVGASTGYVQSDDNFRPTIDDTFDLSTPTERWKNGYFSETVVIDTMTFATGSITDSTGTISFGNEDLVTTGDVDAENLIAQTSATIGGTLSLTTGEITDSGGTISWANNSLIDIDDIFASYLHSEFLTLTDVVQGSGATLDFLAHNGSGKASIDSSLGTINFATNNLDGIGSIGVTSVVSSGTITGTTVTANFGTAFDLVLSNNGVNPTIISDTATTSFGTDTITAGAITVTTVTGGNLSLAGNTLSSTNANGDINLDPNGTGVITAASNINPTVDDSFDLGAASLRWNDLFIAGAIKDGTETLLISTLMLLTNITGANAGDALFWDGTKWSPSNPDTEIDHGELSGLADDDHSQYALLLGRSGGQTLIGGVSPSNDLILQSTSDSTRGSILVVDNVKPQTTAAFSGGWTGVDLGGNSLFFNDLYMRGEAKNFRLENFTFAGLPASSAQNVGRLMYATDTTKAYVDTGSVVKAIGSSKFLSDTSWNGTDTTKDVTVSASVLDARECMWALHDNANDFDRIYCSLKAISATQVRITVSPALPSGSYRLIGLE